MHPYYQHSPSYPRPTPWHCAQVIAAAVAVVEVLVVASAVVSVAVSAHAIPPALASAQLVLHQQQLIDRGGVLARYLPWPWHIPHPPGP